MVFKVFSIDAESCGFPILYIVCIISGFLDVSCRWDLKLADLNDENTVEVIIRKSSWMELMENLTSEARVQM